MILSQPLGLPPETPWNLPLSFGDDSDSIVLAAEGSAMPDDPDKTLLELRQRIVTESLRIPMTPDSDSETQPDAYSDKIPDAVPRRSRTA